MSNQVKTIVVVGAGTMGSGIALTAAQAGIGAVLVDINQEQLDKARAYHTKTLARAVEKQKLTADAAAAAGQKLCYVTTIAETKNADWVVEAASENPEVKKNSFAHSQKSLLQMLCLRLIQVPFRSRISQQQLARARVM